jgi:hypothetical protein
MKEKTKTVLYLNITIFVLVAALAFRTRRLREHFQETATMTATGTLTAGPPTVRCINADGISQCRFVDVPGSTKDNFLIRERTSSPPQFTCPDSGYSFKSDTLSCDTTDSAKAVKSIPLTADQIGSIRCPKADETYIPSLKRCATTVGTVPRCLPGNVSPDSEEVKAAMACYADRYFDNPAVSKFGKDTKLLWDDWTTLGVLNLRSPCCDPVAPAGTIKVGDTVIEKDWKFWTAIISVVLVVVLLVFR